MSDGADCGRRDRHLTSAERSQRRKLGREKLVKAARDAASRATAAEKRELALQEQLARALSDPSSVEDMAIDGEIRLREDLSRPALTAAILKKPLSGASRQQRNLAQHQARDGSRLDYGHHARSPVQVIGIGSSAEGGTEASEAIKVLAARVTELETLVLAQSQSLSRLSNYYTQLHQSSGPVLNNFEVRQAARVVEVPGGVQLSNHNALLHQSSSPVLNNFGGRQAARDVEVPGGAQLSNLFGGTSVLGNRSGGPSPAAAAAAATAAIAASFGRSGNVALSSSASNSAYLFGPPGIQPRRNTYELVTGRSRPVDDDVEYAEVVRSFWNNYFGEGKCDDQPGEAYFGNEGS